MRFRRGPSIVFVISIMAVSAAVALAWPKRVPAVDFIDPLTGPAAPLLDIPFDNYALTPDGLLRVQSASRRRNGRDRPIVRTVSSAYDTRDFVFEIDVRVPPDVQDIVFVGFGSGDPEPGFNEPSGAAVFRLHQLPDSDHINAALLGPAVVGQMAADIRAEETLGRYHSGALVTLRLERVGDEVTFSLPGQAAASHTYRLSRYPGIIDPHRAYLFFGNSAEGTVFSNLRVRARG